MLTRLEVMEYLGISESTYMRKVRKGILKPSNLPGGDRFYKSELKEEFLESKRRGGFDGQDHQQRRLNWLVVLEMNQEPTSN